MQRTPSNPTPTRRQFLWNLGGGLGGIALAQLLADGRLLADDAAPAVRPTAGLHHPAKAKRVVQFFMSGAASQCDTFDYKPELMKLNGQPFDPGEKVELFQSSPGACMASPWGWKQYGQCGKWMSDLVPHLAECVDEIAFIHSMVSKSNVHGPATFMQNTGFVLPGFPSMGAWVGYGLGSMTDNLPTFVVLPDSRGFPPNGPANWSAAFLPATHQGTLIRPAAKNPIADLFPPADASFITPKSETARPGAAQAAQRQPSRRPRGRLAARSPHCLLRAGRAAAAQRPRGARSLRRDRGHAAPVRARPEDHRGFRPQLPGRPAAAGARRAVRAGVERGRQRLSAPQLGQPRRPGPRPRRDGHEHGSPGGGPDQGPQAAGHARRHDRHLDDRVRPHAVQPGGQGARSQPLRLHQLAGRRRHPRRHQLRRQRRVVVQGASKTRPTATTCTPPCCTCWASTTKS